MDCRRCLAGVAALLSLAALLLLLPVRHLVASRVAAEVADTRERVLRTPSAADVTLRLRLFALHVTNPLDVISGHSKPALQQRGPYTYERRVVRTPVPGAAGEDDGVFTYYESEEYTFLPSESCESTDTLPKHQVANLGFWGAAAAAPKYGFTGRLLMDLLTSEYTTRDLVFELRSARDLAFGFTSPLLRSIDRLHSGVQTYVAGITTRVSANTTGGVAESLGECRVRLRPGDDGSGFAGELLEWHGDARGLCCVAEHCPPDAPVPPWSPPSSVAGSSSDGLFFPPSLAAGDSVLKWVAEGMRPMALVSAAQPSLQPSLTSLRTLRFELDMAQFDPAGAGQGFDLLGAPGVLTNQSKWCVHLVFFCFFAGRISLDPPAHLERPCSPRCRISCTRRRSPAMWTASLQIRACTRPSLKLTQQRAWPCGARSARKSASQRGRSWFRGRAHGCRTVRAPLSMLVGLHLAPR